MCEIQQHQLSRVTIGSQNVPSVKYYTEELYKTFFTLLILVAYKSP